ncbi:bifunctional DNA primase/polymerase [Kineosporia sp. NBRC 101677]|uniref:bifunctional DNA primase/polymerase n=1 Tax=Kineosporia sp. NBRC 101677 TaxID=3032197 RepID=UPI0025549E38|nr:bifunctional DNA primase/polymerase [Kineosporia sp. NBRC 101677]
MRAALKLAEGGMQVFPCAPGTKRPMTAHGFLDATSDRDQIRSWWSASPTANLAMTTGWGSFDVLDVDVRATGSGYPSLWRLAEAGIVEGHRFEVQTPSGGLHLYFTGTDQPSGRLAEHHLDFKANGGYVLMPPSVIDGAQYRLTYRSAARHTTTLNWQAARQFLQPPAPPPSPRVVARQQAADIGALSRWVSRLPEGHRNSGLFWAACRAAEHGIDDLSPLAQAAMDAGLPMREATNTIASALRRIGGTARGHPDYPRPAPKPTSQLYVPRPRRLR